MNVILVEPSFPRNQRDFVRVAPLLAHEPPVLSRLLAHRIALLDQGDSQTAPSQIIGAGTADDTGADHHHIRLGL